MSAEEILDKLRLVLEKYERLISHTCIIADSKQEEDKKSKRFICEPLPEDLLASTDLKIENEILGVGTTGAVFRGKSASHGNVAIKFPLVVDDEQSGLIAFRKEAHLATQFEKDDSGIYLKFFYKVNENDDEDGIFCFSFKIDDESHEMKCYKFGIITEVIEGGIIRRRLPDCDSSEEIQGYFIQCLFMVLHSVVKHRKIHGNLICDNFLIRKDQNFEISVFSAQGAQTQVKSNRLCLIDYDHFKDILHQEVSPEDLFSEVFYCILYNHVYLQLFPKVNFIREIVKGQQESVYNVFLKEILGTLGDCLKGNERLLVEQAEKAKELRRVFACYHKENIEDFSLVENLFEKAASILRVQKPDLLI
jgi:hypothetical protein